MIIKKDQSLSVPEYLNNRFFTDALENGLRERKIIINEIHFEWATNPGDNYCSSIYRVLIDFKRFHEQNGKQERISLIIKTIPITLNTQFLENAGVFIKELITYYDVLPRMETLAWGEKFGAKCYYTQREPINTVVLQDLNEIGFSVASRQEGLDWNHSNLILRKLAKFHATSMVLIEMEPKIKEHYQIGILSPENVKGTPTFSRLFATSLKQLIDVSLNWTGFETIRKKLKEYLENFEDITAKFDQPQDNDRFKVLNHGDMWTNNFMFAYDDTAKPKEPTRALFLDFQLSFYGSPGCDINFFLNTSVQLDVLKNRRCELIAGYYETLSATLKDLRYKNIPTFDDLQAELRQRELYGLFGLYAFLPMVTMSKELSNGNTIESMADENIKYKRFAEVFANKNLQEHLKYSLKRLEDLRVLDEL